MDAWLHRYAGGASQSSQCNTYCLLHVKVLTWNAGLPDYLIPDWQCGSRSAVLHLASVAACMPVHQEGAFARNACRVHAHAHIQNVTHWSPLDVISCRMKGIALQGPVPAEPICPGSWCVVRHKHKNWPAVLVLCLPQ
eukprot:scaffold28144_cov22-Tisochrysis_lutea.AAC.1